MGFLYFELVWDFCIVFKYPVRMFVKRGLRALINVGGRLCICVFRKKRS